jgi:hypothetical protein
MVSTSTKPIKWTGRTDLDKVDLDKLFGRIRNEPVHFEPEPIDVLAQCPKCKTVETLQFLNGKLMRSRKFFETDGKVFHDCGSSLPCRLHK